MLANRYVTVRDNGASLMTKVGYEPNETRKKKQRHGPYSREKYPWAVGAWPHAMICSQGTRHDRLVYVPSYSIGTKV